MSKSLRALRTQYPKVDVGLREVLLEVFYVIQSHVSAALFATERRIFTATDGLKIKYLKLIISIQNYLIAFTDKFCM